MKHSFLFFFAFLVTISSFAQSKFEKGYLINNENVKIQCFIGSRPRQTIPSEFIYKLTESAGTITATPADVKEFAIEGGLRFISEEVLIDISSNDIQDLSDEKDPIWSKQRLFLKVLVDGKASLYEYQTQVMLRFFYKVPDKSIQQLVYKRFLPSKDEKFINKENVTFRQQLWTDVRFPALTVNTVEQISYEKTELQKFFIDYNQQNGAKYSTYSRKHEKGAFHLRITPGLNYSTLTVDNILSGAPDFDFGSQTGFRIGIEPELIFPYTNKKLGLVLEPAFQYFSATKFSSPQTMYVHLYTVEFPIGVRYYFFPGRSFSIFLNAFFIPAPTLHPNSDIQYEGYHTLWIEMRNSFAAGAGMNWKRFDGEIRYYSNRRFISSLDLNERYTRVSLILGFRIF